MSAAKVMCGPSIRRMPMYLQKLVMMRNEGIEFASTTRLAQYVNLEPIIVRKDISLTGITGRVGVGYHTDELIAGIRRYLGWDVERPACLVGAGVLGSALLGYSDFTECGLTWSCVFDSDPQKVGTVIHGHEVLPIQRMSEVVKERKPTVALICVSARSAQSIVNELIDCGVKCFWNFADVCLQVPSDVVVQREVVSGGYAMLSVKMNRQNEVIDD